LSADLKTVTWIIPLLILLVFISRVAAAAVTFSG
jgi:hypothetical protein